MPIREDSRIITLDGLVKTSIYGVLSKGDSQQTTCIVETRPGILLLEVYAYLYIYVFT